MAFHIFTSVKAEDLAEKFAQHFFTEGSDPFISQWCITQTEGVQRWLSLFCAKQNRIMANCEFLYPVRVLQIIARLLGDQRHAIDEILTWNIYKHLEDLEATYPVLGNYVHQGEPSAYSCRRYQLANQLTAVYNRYMSYRVEMLIAWSHQQLIFTNQEHEAWQCELWNLLRQEENSPIGGAYNVIERLLTSPQELVTDLTSIRDKLPTHIAIFGVSELSEIYVEFFQKLSQVVDISLYYLTPCYDFWGDTNRRDEEDNFLLSSWGVSGKNFHNSLAERNLIGAEEEVINDLSSPISTNSAPLLQQLQQKIKTREKITNLCWTPQDESLLLSSHYSRIREIEGLYDFLAKKFKDDPKLQAGDVFVFVPNIADYNREIQAVFGNVEDPQMAIPFMVADQSQLELNPLAKVIVNLFELAKGRFTASEVFDFIQQPTIKKNFALSEEDIPKIRKWILDSNIRWGKNASTITELTHVQPIDKELLRSTWPAGLERLIVSFLRGDSEDHCFEDIALIQLQQEDRILLGKFYRICLLIFDLCQRIKTCTLATNPTKEETKEDSWQEIFTDIMENLLAQVREVDQERFEIEKSFSNLTYRWFMAGINDKIPFKVAGPAICDHLEKRGGVGGLFRGKVTFCQFQPMRTIPAKVICILGLNDGEFPHQDLKLGFDLMNISLNVNEYYIRSGEKSVSRSDRYLFLETFMATREQLYLSFVGQDDGNNKEKMPSVVVQELLNMLTNSQIKKEDFVIKHPLFAYSKNYFLADKKDPRLDSLSKLNFQIASSSSMIKEKRNTWITTPLPKKEVYHFTFDDVINFFQNPLAFYLRNVLQISHYKINDQKLADDEVFELNLLEKYLLKKGYLTGDPAYLRHEQLLGKLPWMDATKDQTRLLDDLDLLFLQEYKKNLSLLTPVEKRPTIYQKQIKLQDSTIINLSGSFPDVYTTRPEDSLVQTWLATGKINDKTKIKLLMQDLLVREFYNIVPWSKTDDCRTFCVGESNEKLEHAEIIFPNYQTISITTCLKWMIQGCCLPLPLYPHVLLKKNVSSYISQNLNKAIHNMPQDTNKDLLKEIEIPILFGHNDPSEYPQIVNLVDQAYQELGREAQDVIKVTVLEDRNEIWKWQ